MSNYWSKIARNLDPYVPGEQPKDRQYIKLNTNENPYPPSAQVISAIHSATNEDLKLYPDPNGEALRRAIASRFELSADQVFLGNGSDEVLAFTFLAFFDPGRSILFPDITYSFYPVYANLFHIPYRCVPLNEDFTLPVSEFRGDNHGVIFPNPNAPTGNAIAAQAVEEILRHNQEHVVVIDEAYIAFGGESAVPLIRRYPNLLVIHTLSKSHSLAGLRVGFAMGDPELIRALETIKNSVNSYTLDRLALAGAEAAIKDTAYYQGTKIKIMRTRAHVVSELEKMGFTVIPSQANFIFIRHPVQDAAELFRQLKEHGILVRYFPKPRIDQFLRVSIGNDAEMAAFLRTVSGLSIPYGPAPH
ncbi:MAG: histidinol-phosphate transaminase [Peptococcaceae bacterium]|jgi:histidinol-phosphate aminotransferase|nr:histidinol-phosphate transaminase [Peptococcaceae bacterium]